MAKSADAFRTIAEVAEWLDTPAHVLRFWESKFNQIRPVKRAGGRRYYRPEDMALLGGIKTLLHEEGLSVKSAQKLLRERGVKHVAGLSPPLDGSPPIRDVSPPEVAATPEQAQPAPVVSAPGPKELPAFRPFGNAGRAEPPAPAMGSGDTSGDPPLTAPAPKPAEPLETIEPVETAEPVEPAESGLPSFLTGKSGIGAVQHRSDPPLSAPPEPDITQDAAPSDNVETIPPEAVEQAPDEVQGQPETIVAAAALPPIPAPPEVADLLPRPNIAEPDEDIPTAAAAPLPARAAMVRSGPGLLALLQHRDRLAAAPEKLAPILEHLGALAERLAEDPTSPPR